MRDGSSCAKADNSVFGNAGAYSEQINEYARENGADELGFFRIIRGKTVFQKRYRLTKRGSFTYVYRRGESRSAGVLRITYLRGRGVPKIGVSVPNTVGKAVVRNKVRRRIRAALRPCIPYIKPAQIVISARKGADGLAYSEIESRVKDLLTLAGLYEKKTDGGKRN